MLAIASYCLQRGYATQFSAQQQGKGAARRSAGEAAWYAIFQCNFAFFSFFAFLAYAVLPSFSAGGARVMGLPWGWVHSFFSIAPASLLVYAFDKL